jgi:hypothetical protein
VYGTRSFDLGHRNWMKGSHFGEEKNGFQVIADVSEIPKVSIYKER